MLSAPLATWSHAADNHVMYMHGPYRFRAKRGSLAL